MRVSMVLNVLQSISAPVPAAFICLKNNSKIPPPPKKKNFSNGKMANISKSRSQFICNLKCVEDGNEEPQEGGNGWSVKCRN